MSDFDSIDYFTDQSIVGDPYAYYDHLRSKCPVQRDPAYGVITVTGHEEALEVYKDSETYSACNSVSGPFPPLPFEPEGDDIGAQILEFRDQMPLSEHMVTMDAPDHTRARALLNRLLTPKRLKENEEFMWRLADQQLDEFVASGSCELIRDYAKPFSLLVIADLLGVPAEDHEEFREVLGAPREGARPGALEKEPLMHNPLEFLDERFAIYIEDRRRAPRDDVLTGLANAKYPDGSTPDVLDVVHSATFLFAAGQETTVKLISAALKVAAERPDLQQLLRDDPTRIPPFLEETLRLESPVKSDFRLARTTTTLGDLDIPAGTTVMSVLGAANRDPRRFEDPHEFKIDRHNVRDHMAFGRGIHSCPGGPLARAEGRISLERMLARMGDIKVSDAGHGPEDARSFSYEPTYILRGLTELHLEFTPIR